MTEHPTPQSDTIAEKDIKEKNNSPRIALFLLVIMLLWVGSGFILPSNSTADTPEETVTAEEVFLVSYTPSTAIQKTKYLSVNGTSNYSRKVDLKAEIEGKVTSIRAKESTFIKKGDIILTIETRDRERRLKQAQELVRQKELDYAAAKKLNQKGYQAETKLLQEATALESAYADLIQAEINLASTVVQAPFDGILERVYVDEGTLVGANVDSGEMGRSNLATIIDVSPMLVVGHISERFAFDLSLDTPATVSMLSGKDVEGKVSYISSVADELTRTFMIEVEIDNSDNKAYPSGATSFISLPVKEENVHKLTLSTLVLNKEGQLGVRTFDTTSADPSIDDQPSQGNVSFYPVSIFMTSPEFIWVSGLPDAVNIIIKGHGFVQTGQKVVGKIQQSNKG